MVSCFLVKEGSFGHLGETHGLEVEMVSLSNGSRHDRYCFQFPFVDIYPRNSIMFFGYLVKGKHLRYKTCFLVFHVLVLVWPQMC